MTTQQVLQDILVEDYRLSRAQVGVDATLTTLGLDSLSVLELMFKIEDRFKLKIMDDVPTDLVTVGDVVSFVDRLLVSKVASDLQLSA